MLQQSYAYLAVLSCLSETGCTEQAAQQLKSSCERAQNSTFLASLSFSWTPSFWMVLIGGISLAKSQVLAFVISLCLWEGYGDALYDGRDFQMGFVCPSLLTNIWVYVDVWGGYRDLFVLHCGAATVPYHCLQWLYTMYSSYIVVSFKPEKKFHTLKCAPFNQYEDNITLTLATSIFLSVAHFFLLPAVTGTDSRVLSLKEEKWENIEL